MNIDDITPDVRVEDLLEDFPEAQDWLLKRGVVCVQCGEIFWGRLFELIITKGMDPEQIVADLKEFLRSLDK